MRKLLAILIIIYLLPVTISAHRSFHLPEQHSELVDEQINHSFMHQVSFEDRSMQELQAHSRFAISADLLDQALPEFQSPIAGKMVDYASKFLGTRYSLGASGPKAFDCSGFTSYVYKNFGISLNRTSREQYLQGDNVSVDNLHPGDLLFFSSRGSGRGRVGHVAIVVSVDNENKTCKFIHASSSKGVTYQTFPDNGYYQKHFLGARRILGTDLDTSSELAMNK